MKLRKMIVAVLWLVGLAACDPQRIDKLEEGVATEADVRRQFGEPAAVYTEPGGARTLDYPRQPEGQRNYMITIGADGKMSALRQVLQPANFAKITPGLDKATVRRILGPPAKMQTYALKQEEVWDWRWLDGSQSMLFSATFNAAGMVTATAQMPDPRENLVGGK
jgi:outer membrane protein assembly factor BamE (lipoprotein component of BamABCDE complex)